MRLVFISDTHSMHPWMSIPEGDILFHAGDFSKRGRPEEVRDFLDWYAALPHRVKIFIAGNHDFMAERDPQAFRAMIPDNLIYMEDSGTTVEGLRIWGSLTPPATSLRCCATSASGGSRISTKRPEVAVDLERSI